MLDRPRRETAAASGRGQFFKYDREALAVATVVITPRAMRVSQERDA